MFSLLLFYEQISHNTDLTSISEIL